MYLKIRLNMAMTALNLLVVYAVLETGDLGGNHTERTTMSRMTLTTLRIIARKTKENNSN